MRQSIINVYEKTVDAVAVEKAFPCLIGNDSFAEEMILKANKVAFLKKAEERNKAAEEAMKASR